MEANLVFWANQKLNLRVPIWLRVASKFHCWTTEMRYLRFHIGGFYPLLLLGPR